MKRISAQFVVLSMLFLGCCAGVFAQATSQISGTITDASGAVVAGAQITATQTDTGVTRSATSDANGVYSLPSLPLGPYRLEVKKEGFTTYVQSGIVLQVGTAPTVNPVLKVGAVNQTVQVESTAPMVDTTTTGVGQVVNSQSVVDLPLNGRQVTQLITLAGAANSVQYGFGGAPSVGNLVSSKNYPNEALVSVGGGMLNGTTYLMDGGTFNDPFNNLNLPTPFPDAIQEFNVQTSALPAEYGLHTGGAINIATKSGGNQFHGDAFEFVRNSAFNAKDFFSVGKNSPNGLSDGLKRNQFGGTIGGPIKKNKLFFFLGYQGTLIRDKPPANQAILPTTSELQGNFQNYVTNCLPPDPKTGLPVQLKGPYYSNNMLSTTLYPSGAPADVLAFASHFPVGPEPCGLTTFQLIANQNEHMGIGRVDYQINSKQTLFVRYFGTHSLVPSSYNGNELTVVNAGTDDTVNSLVLGHTYLVSTNMLNSFHFTYNTDGITKFQVPIVTPADVGVQGMYISAAPFTHFSNINITGDFQSAGGFATPGLVNTKTWQLADDFSWTKGSHQLQFGASFIRPSQTSTFCVYCNGLFTFSGALSGDPMADFVAGALGSMVQLNISHDNENWRYLGVYAQDSWKVNPRLTLNYGLRWEPYFGGSFPLQQVTHFDMTDFLNNEHSTQFPNAPAGTLYPGDPGFNTGSRPNYTRWNNFAPRIGLAWDPTGGGKTLIRASWGMLFDTPETLFFYNYAGEPLWGSSVAIIPPAGAADTFANPWSYYSTGANIFPTTQNSTTPYPTYSSYETAPLHVRNAYMEQWNLTIQRQIGAAWLLKASYLGNDLVHLWTIKETNPGVYITPDSTGINIGGCTFNVYNPSHRDRGSRRPIIPATRAGTRTSGACSRNWIRSKGHSTEGTRNWIPAGRAATTRCSFQRSTVSQTTSRCWRTTPGRIASPICGPRRSTPRSTPIRPIGGLTAETARRLTSTITSTSPPFCNRRIFPRGCFNGSPAIGSLRQSFRRTPAVISRSRWVVRTRTSRPAESAGNVPIRCSQIPIAHPSESRRISLRRGTVGLTQAPSPCREEALTHSETSLVSLETKELTIWRARGISTWMSLCRAGSQSRKGSPSRSAGKPSTSKIE